MIDSENTFEYDIALSYKSGDPLIESYVDRVETSLAERGLRVFNYRTNRVRMLGLNINEETGAIYGGSARFFVLFISRGYGTSHYTSLERSIADRRARSDGRRFILPARFDDTSVDESLEAIQYVDLRTMGPHEFAQLVATRLFEDSVGALQLEWAKVTIDAQLSTALQRLGALRLLHIRDGDEGLPPPYLKNLTYEFSLEDDGRICCRWERFSGCGTQYKLHILDEVGKSPGRQATFDALRDHGFRDVSYESSIGNRPGRYWFIIPAIHTDLELAITPEGHVNQWLPAEVNSVLLSSPMNISWVHEPFT